MERPVETGLNQFFVGHRKSKIAMDWRPDRSWGLDQSIIFPVLISYGLVRSQSFSSLETGPSNTNMVLVVVFCRPVKDMSGGDSM
jgi:hypothetical protein